MEAVTLAEATWENGLTRIGEEMAAAGVSLVDAREAFERRYLDALIRVHKGNISRSSRQSGFHRNTIIRKIKDKKIPVERVHASPTLDGRTA